VSGYQPRVFYGWWVVLTAALGLCLGSPPIMTFSFSVLKPLIQAGWGAVSFAYTLCGSNRSKRLKARSRNKSHRESLWVR
jgi:hypothetical protein